MKPSELNTELKNLGLSNVRTDVSHKSFLWINKEAGLHITIFPDNQTREANFHLMNSSTDLKRLTGIDFHYDRGALHSFIPANSKQLNAIAQKLKTNESELRTTIKDAVSYTNAEKSYSNVTTPADHLALENAMAVKTNVTSKNTAGHAQGA